MEMCVDSYREAVTQSQTRAATLRSAALTAAAAAARRPSGKPRPIRDGLGRVLGRLRARSSSLQRGRGGMGVGSGSGSGSSGWGRERETLWKLSACSIFPTRARLVKGVGVWGLTDFSSLPSHSPFCPFFFFFSILETLIKVLVVFCKPAAPFFFFAS
jgi:hypothetical protein